MTRIQVIDNNGRWLLKGPGSPYPRRQGARGEAVPVLTVLDSSGGVYEAVLPSLMGIEAALDGRIAFGSVVSPLALRPTRGPP